MQATLYNLLTEEEKERFRKTAYVQLGTNLSTPIKDLTVQDLSNIGLFLISEEESKRGAVLSVYALTELQYRALKHNLDIF